MQLNYDTLPLSGLPGMLADGADNDVVSAANYGTPTFDVQVAAVQNSTAYSVIFGFATPVTVTYTSANPDTKAGILAGLLAAINGTSNLGFTAQVVDPLNGPLLLKSSTPFQSVVPTVTANLTIAQDLGFIPYGAFVVMDVTATKCRLPQIASDIGIRTLGQALSSQYFENPLLAPPGMPGFDNAPLTVAGYGFGSQVNVCRMGKVWTTAEGAVNPGDPVFVRFTSGTGTQKGSARADGDSGTCIQLPGAKWLVKAAIGGLSKVQLHLV